MGCGIARSGFEIRGLWSGLMVGATTTCVVQWVILARLDWPAEAAKAQQISHHKRKMISS